jgi:hypothetical protein
MHNQPQARLEPVNIHEVMEKMQSKRDVYNFLTHECEAYLPKLDTVNMHFLKQVTRGAKDVSTSLTNPLVCQALSSQGGSSTIDRGSQHD